MKLILAAVFSFVGMANCDTSLDNFSSGSLEFTANLYKVLKESQGNFIASPLSVEILLALTQMGAEGETGKEMSTALRLPSGKHDVQKAISSLLAGLSGPNDELNLLSANKMYVQNGFEIKDAFKRTAISTFKSEVENIEFSKAQEAADNINQWVEGKTNSKIKDLISSDQLNSDTRLVLINALYFKAPWKIKFDPKWTRKELFYASAVKNTSLEMMHITHEFKFYQSLEDNVKYLQLEYGSSAESTRHNQVTMTIVLPNEIINGLQRIEQNLEKFLQPVNYGTETVIVTIPKFEVESNIPLKDILMKLGITQLFDHHLADLSGISDDDLYVSDIIQKAYIEVNEEGTEAGAASAGKYTRGNWKRLTEYCA